MNDFKIKLILFSNGERFPVLINLKTGIPDYWTTIYSITQLRGKGRTTATISQTIRNIMLFKIILIRLGLSESIIEQRFKEGWGFHLYEIEGLAEECKFFIQDILNDMTPSKIALTSFKQFRTKNAKKIFMTVDANTACNRIRDIRDFIDWWINAHLAKLPINGISYIRLKETKDFIKSNLTSRIPKTMDNSSIEGREGLSNKHLDLLLEMINHKSSNNPWKSEFTKRRNELLFLWLLQFGIRRGELLNLKISDINFQEETFYILRRADDPTDPRRSQPNVKTLGRKLAMPNKIATLTYDFIIKFRAKLPKAKKHEFLFVADRTGEPLSIIAVNKIFEQLKHANNDLPKDLSPHVLRHTWNDKFSELMDEKNIPEELEKKIRSNAMGWSPTSDTAATYTRRHTRQKANEAILEISNRLLDKYSENKK